jgi:hypothetical protein
VRRSARVNDAARVWQLLHQQTRTTGVIQMNVRQENVVHITGPEVLLPQAVE